MGNKVMISIGKLALASSIGLTGIASGLTLSQQHVAAAETEKEVNFQQRAQEMAELVKAGNLDAVYQQLSPQLQAVLPKEELPRLWTSLTAPYGKISDMKFKDVKNDGVHTNATFIITAEQGPYELVLRFNKEGKIDDLLFNVISSPESFVNPSYNHPENYTEKPVVIGEGEFALPGMLTIPKGKGPFPVVVLVHGSGPHDMDETMYAFKPFRDIAVGLANEGIAVLRYDKRTFAHAMKSGLTPKLTIQEETVIDANLAVEKLKTVPEIDAKNIFVLGHSQGAYALPLIVENDTNKDIKGVIGAAGMPGKFQDLMLWQFEHRLQMAKDMKAPAEQIKTLEDTVALYKQQFGILNDHQYSKDNIPASFQLGNDYWWFDLRDYVPGEMAKSQTVPTLLLQGGKDIQVPPSELDAWKKALKNRDNVTYKLYPDMFHMLVDYKGAANGVTEYMTPGNVSQAFLSDIAKWVKTGKLTSDDGKDDKPEQPNKPGKKVYWDGLLMKKGQIGKVTVTKPINLWKREGNKLVFERVLKPGEQYRVYRYDNKFGGQFGLGGDHYVTNIKGYIEYKTPSKAKLKELNGE